MNKPLANSENNDKVTTMNGKIHFNSIEEVAAFLKAFAGSTATFEVYRTSSSSKWTLEFLGGV